LPIFPSGRCSRIFKTAPPSLLVPSWPSTFLGKGGTDIDVVCSPKAVPTVRSWLTKTAKQLCSTGLNQRPHYIGIGKPRVHLSNQDSSCRATGRRKATCGTARTVQNGKCVRPATILKPVSRMVVASTSTTSRRQRGRGLLLGMWQTRPVPASITA
jgi:hypothetical protein